MDEVEKLEHLSLVSKICTELENHLGLNDKDLAEFIIALADKNDTFETFKKVLMENGAEFSDSFIANLLRIIQHMKPKRNKEASPQPQSERDRLAEKFPGLAIPNDPKLQAEKSAEKKKKKKDKDKKKKISAEDDVVNDAMAELEALAPSNGNRRSRSRNKGRKRSRDTNRRDGRRSTIRDKHGRQREFSGDRKKRRCISRDKKIAESLSEPLAASEPEIGKIYSGKVANIVPYGSFVQLEGLHRHWEGLVHISQLRREGRVRNVSDVVARGHKVKV